MRHIFINNTISEVSDTFDDPNFPFLTEEQEAYYTDHPEATAREVMNLGVSDETPFTSPDLSIEERKQQAIDILQADFESKKQTLITPDLVASIVTVLISLGGSGISMLSGDGDVGGSDLGNFLQKYDELSTQEDTLASQIQAAGTPDQIENILKSRFSNR